MKMRPLKPESAAMKRPASPSEGLAKVARPEHEPAPEPEPPMYDTDSSLELDETMFQTTDENEREAYHLPAELLEREEGEFDLSSNDGEDHTGFWCDEDLGTLLLAVNNNRRVLKGNFVGASGGKKRRDDAWEAVKVYVNKRCNTDWTVKQCKDKVSRFAKEAKEQYNLLRKELFKTGGGVIDDEMYLTANQELALEYVGVEGVFGVPGVHAVSLTPDVDQTYMNEEDAAARGVWDYMDSKEEQYVSLPVNKVKVTRPKRKTPRPSRYVRDF